MRKFKTRYLGSKKEMNNCKMSIKNFMHPTKP